MRVGKVMARCGDLTLLDEAKAEEDAERGPLDRFGGGS